MIKRKPEDPIISSYGSILNSLKNNDPGRCPDPELIAGFHHRELSGKKKHQIEDHIAFCPLCLKALEALLEVEEAGIVKAQMPKNWQAIEKQLDLRFHEHLRKTPAIARGQFAKKKSVPWFDNITIPTIVKALLQPKKLVYAGALTSVVIVGLYSYAYISRDKNFSLARIKPEKLTQLRAGMQESGFTEGLRQYSREKYGKAIQNLEEFLKENPDHYAGHYYLGISRLADAEVSLLGLPYRFDRSEVDKGINDLGKAASLSGDNLYYLADCSWYLGKACLMLDEPVKAREWFNRIIQLDLQYPERMEDTRKMLSIMDSIEAVQNNSP
jgi:tetratricopeptide (TPR) repeat protein